jgi:serine/threonine-protein kinase RIO1
MKIFTKHFRNMTRDEIRHEVFLQRIASSLGVSPAVVDTDYEKVMHMEQVGMCIADKYGEEIGDIPAWIRKQIVEHLWTLYSCCQIQYIDITPYNFIEEDGRVWVIDFGDAFRNRPRSKLHPFLKRVFDTWNLTAWNPEFK